MAQGIVTGGRDYRWTLDDVVWVAECCIALDITRLYHGACATGADQIIGDAQNAKRIHHLLRPDHTVEIVPMPANWCLQGRFDPTQGPIRNSEMVCRCGPGDYCLAWPGGNGTADTVCKAKARGMRILTPHDRVWEQPQPQWEQLSLLGGTP